MRKTAVETLLQELATLTYGERMRRMVEMGRAAAGTPAVAAVLAELEQGGVYERGLALQSCYGSGDGAHALRAWADPSRGIRRLAARLMPIVCDDHQMETAFGSASQGQQRALLRRLSRRHRQAPIDAFLTSLAGRQDPRLTRLLPFGASAVVRQYLSLVWDRAGAGDWRRLARRHPEHAADAMQQRAEAAGSLDLRLLQQANVVVPILADACPERALLLVDLLERHASPSQLELQRLAERRPIEMAERALRSPDRIGFRLDRAAHRLEPELLASLVTERSETVPLRGGWFQYLPSEWFRRLPPERRAMIYATCGRGWRDGEGALSTDVVALLPRPLREEEGRRHLALPALATRPAQRLPYTAFLPWDEAREALEPFLRNPDAEQRAVALAALIAATRFQRDRLSDALALIRTRRNEQDPVRGAMLRGLQELPPGIWRAEHLDDLGQILRDALDAPDLSFQTAAAAEGLILALLPSHPHWSAPWLASLVGARGQISFHDLGQRLSDADVRRIAPDLLPVLRTWETREREAQLLALARSLGKRLRGFEELLGMLERIARETRSSWLAAEAMQLLAAHGRGRFAELIPKLLRDDPSTVTLAPVHGYLHRRRQDLLTPFLGRKAYRGRFSTGRTRFVLPLQGGFHRWTPAQQSLFGETLQEVLHDRDRDSPTSLFAVAQLAALPAVSKAPLVGLASLRNQTIAVRDAALRALGQLDDGEGVPVLLEALGDDRGRIAIYALRRALLEMPAGTALPLLRAAPMERVTVAKEVVRLLGELATPEAYQDLVALDGRELHRDIRVALLRALWGHLEREETWPLLDRAAASSDPALAAGVVRIPADRLSLEAQRRLAALQTTLLSHPEPKLRVDVLQRLAQLPIVDADQVLLRPLLAALGSELPDESSAAGRAIFATYAGRDADRVGTAVGSILGDRRALQTAVRALVAELHGSRSHLLPTARAVLDALAGDPLTVSLRVDLAAHALPWSDLGEFLTRLAEADTLHAEALMAAVHALENAVSRPDVAGLGDLENALAAHEDARLRRLALAALLGQARDARGWSDERLARLERYRADPSPLVAAAAQFTWTP